MNKIKAQVRIPTTQYGYVEYSIEGTTDQIKEFHDQMVDSFKDKAGLPLNEWRECIDRYLSEGTMNPDEYDQMNRSQKTLIQEIKRSFNRLKNKNE